MNGPDLAFTGRPKYQQMLTRYVAFLKAQVQRPDLRPDKLAALLKELARWELTGVR